MLFRVLWWQGSVVRAGVVVKESRGGVGGSTRIHSALVFSLALTVSIPGRVRRQQSTIVFVGIVDRSQLRLYTASVRVSTVLAAVLE